MHPTFERLCRYIVILVATCLLASAGHAADIGGYMQSRGVGGDSVEAATQEGTPVRHRSLFELSASRAAGRLDPRSLQVGDETASRQADRGQLSIDRRPAPGRTGGWTP